MDADTVDLAFDELEEIQNRNVDDDIPDQGAHLCELHTYDARYDSKGDLVYLQTGWQYEDGDSDTNGSEYVALVLTRYWRNKTLQSTSLMVNSPLINTALRDVIKSYPGINMNANANIVIEDKPKCLFHYRTELREYAREAETTQPCMVDHVDLCLKYMERALRKEIETYNILMTDPPGADFEHLWMPFKIGQLIYSKSEEEERVFRLLEMHHNAPDWSLKLERIETNGKTFGLTVATGRISFFKGYVPLTDLDYFPLEYHPEKARVKERLVARGRKYVSLSGIHYKSYSGKAKITSANDEDDGDEFRSESSDEDNAISSDGAPLAMRVRERIMLDANQHRRNAGVFGEWDKKIRPRTDEDFLICSHQLGGFSLKEKAWGFYPVSQIQDVDFDARAFAALVLAKEKKVMIEALVKMQNSSIDKFDDLIKGKGRGIVFLLHGPPGTGKTFTAESIADHTKRPLYTIGCSDLSHEADYAERQLSKALSLAKRWNAITLIDEADVFMAERDIKQLDRNELVSVLLRQMEYFDGVLFLTTNRVEAIDSAFISRTHLAVAYPPLSVASRRQIWWLFLISSSSTERAPWFNDDFLDRVSAFDINGRRIKNAVRVAHALAAHQDRDMLAKDIFSILNAMMSFAEDFVERPSSKRARSDEGDDIACKRQKASG